MKKVYNLDSFFWNSLLFSFNSRIAENGTREDPFRNFCVFHTTKIFDPKIDHSNYCRSDERVIKKLVSKSTNILIISSFKSGIYNPRLLGISKIFRFLLEDSNTHWCCIFMMGTRLYIYYITDFKFFWSMLFTTNVWIVFTASTK